MVGWDYHVCIVRPWLLQESQLGPKGRTVVCAVAFQLDLGAQDRRPWLHGGDACGVSGSAACWLEPTVLSQHNSSQGQHLSHHPPWSGNTITPCMFSQFVCLTSGNSPSVKGGGKWSCIYCICNNLPSCDITPVTLPHGSMSLRSGRAFISALQTVRCRHGGQELEHLEWRFLCSASRICGVLQLCALWREGEGSHIVLLKVCAEHVCSEYRRRDCEKHGCHFVCINTSCGDM